MTSPQPSPPAWPPRGWHECTVGVTEVVPYVQGHFPGHPVVPGVAQLELAANIADHLYRGAWPLALRRVKFRAPVQPAPPGPAETSLTCQLFPTLTAGEVQFILNTRTQSVAPEAAAGTSTLVAEGFLLLTNERSKNAPPAAPRPPQGRKPAQPEISAVLPHRAPALFLREVLHLGRAAEDSSWFAGRVPPENFLVRDGKASVFAALEFAAQGAACLNVLLAYPGTPARMLEGWLVGVKAATFHAPDFPVEAPLVASLRTTTRGSFVNVTTQVAAGQVLVAEGELQIYVQ